MLNIMSSFSIPKIACPHPAPPPPQFDECSYNKLIEMLFQKAVLSQEQYSISRNKDLY